MSRRALAAGVVAALAATAAVLSIAGTDTSAQDGAFDAETRRAVERLRTDAPRPAASAQEALERLRLLWRWVNAHALSGRPVPIDLPLRQTMHVTTLRMVSGRPEDARLAALAGDVQRSIDAYEVGIDLEDRDQVIREASAFVDRSARELALWQDHGEPLGGLRLEGPDSLRAATLATATQVWTVGELPMRPGGSLVLANQPRGRGVSLQTDDAQAEGFVTASTSRSGARLVPSLPRADWRGFTVRDVLAFRLEGAALEPGDEVTITYGDRSSGGPGFRVHPFSNDRLLFPVWLDLEGSGEAWTPAWPALTVTGAGEIVQLNLVAPSIVAAGEPFTLALRAEDRFENLSSARTGEEYEILLDGEPHSTVPAGSSALYTLDGVRLDEPGVHRFEVRSRDGRLHGRSNPVRVVSEPAQRVFWGDTHGHSGFAEGQGSPEGYYRFGRDVARLDFLSLSEHDIWMDDLEWLTLRRAVERYRDPGRFTPILGYEWSAFETVGGHHNVYFADAAPERRRVPIQEAPELAELWDGLRRRYPAEDVLVIPHAHQAGDWRRSDGELERLVEVTSGHGTFEFFGRRYLENGFQVGFIGSTDNHNGHPGYTGVGNQQLGGLAAVYAPENTTAAIFRALRERATYATTGERILLEAALNGQPMGRRLPDAPVRTITARVSGTQPIDFVDVIKNGRVVFRRRELDTALASRARVQVWLESSTEVYNGHYNPRGARPWKGSVRVEGAQLAGFEEPWFAHPETFRVRRSEDDASRLEIDFPTRGRGKALLLDLEAASATTRIVVELGPTRERAGSPGVLDRPLAELGAERFEVALGDLLRGPAVRELQVVHNVDRLQVQLLPADAALDVELEYRDTTPAAPGDWYYVRVGQIDGAMAFSSPWWVGGKPE